MLDFADAVAINKFERRGADDALPRRAPPAVRNREFGSRAMPVFGTSRRAVQRRRRHRALPAPRGLLALRPAAPGVLGAGRHARSRPARRRWCRRPAERYLAEVAETVRATTRDTDERRRAWRRRRQHLPTAPDRRSDVPRRCDVDAERRSTAADDPLLDRLARCARSRGDGRHVARGRRTLGHAGAAGRAAPRFERPRRAAALPPRGRTCPAASRSPPACSR